MIKYSCHHPKQIYQLSSELLIHESTVKNSVETNGEICCPHEVFIRTGEQIRSNISNILVTSGTYIQQ